MQINANEIKDFEEIANEINNFRACYVGIELWGKQDSYVSPEDLIVFLIENPHFQEIANKINKLR